MFAKAGALGNTAYHPERQLMQRDVARIGNNRLRLRLRSPVREGEVNESQNIRQRKQQKDGEPRAFGSGLAEFHTENYRRYD